MSTTSSTNLQLLTHSKSFIQALIPGGAERIESIANNNGNMALFGYARRMHAFRNFTYIGVAISAISALASYLLRSRICAGLGVLGIIVTVLSLYQLNKVVKGFVADVNSAAIESKKAWDEVVNYKLQTEELAFFDHIDNAPC